VRNLRCGPQSPAYLVLNLAAAGGPVIDNTSLLVMIPRHESSSPR
jgi:hypothetical protein